LLENEIMELLNFHYYR